MVPHLEALEDRMCPATTLADPQQLLAQMQATLAADQLMFSAISGIFTNPQPSLLGNIQGLTLNIQLDQIVVTQLSSFMNDLGPILLATTLGPRG